VLFILFYACGEKSNSHDKVTKFIDSKCATKTSCQLDISNIIEQDWDVMYYFDSQVSLDSLNSIMGVYYQHFEDVSSRLVALKGNSVVFNQDMIGGIEETKRGEWYIVLPKLQHYKKMLHGSTLFEVEKVKVADTYIYRLTHLEN
jgi:hypothetical protein